MNWLLELRKQLHRNPELAFEEHKTGYILKHELAKRVRIHINPQAIRKGATEPFIHVFENSPGFLVEYTCCDTPYKLFRADMDALPITENTGCDFASEQSGLMHACGHDIHLSVLMGLIDRVLQEQPQQNLLFLFQPAEEGKGGALSVLAEGILQQFNIGSVFALHVAGNMPVGTVSSRSGIFFGIPQEFDIRFIGKSAHVAFPEEGRDAIAAAIEFENMMKQDIQGLSAEKPVIFHVGRIEGGRVRNVIADFCTLEGTHRSLDREARDEMNRLAEKNSKIAADLFGCQYEVDFLCSYDAVVNSENLVEKLRKATLELGYNYQEAEIVMTGEDFGFFTSRYPGLLFWLGSGCNHPLHSPEFLPDEACIVVGVEIMFKIIE